MTNRGAAVTLRMYSEFAAWWPLISAPADYAEEAEFYRRQLVAACGGRARTLLELGCGGGNNASHLKRHFEMTLSDLSPGMLDVSRALNPECEHVQGDMQTLRLGRTFDCVLIHDAIVYMISEGDLRRAMETAFAHCRPGGAVLFAPDHVRDTFRPSTSHGGEDGESGSLRYLEWTWDPDPADSTYTVDYTYTMRERDGSLHVEHDRHIEGLFARAEWLRFMSDAGFEPARVPFEHSEVEPGTTDVFVGRRRA